MIHLNYRLSMLDHAYQFSIQKYELIRINEKSPHNRKDVIYILEEVMVKKVREELRRMQDRDD